MNKADIKRWKKERKELKRIDIQNLPAVCNEFSPRLEAVTTLLRIAGGWPLNMDLAKAAIELASYNDRVAHLLIQEVINEDYKTLLLKGIIKWN